MDRKGSQLIFWDTEVAANESLPETADVAQAPFIRGQVRAVLGDKTEQIQEIEMSPIRGGRGNLDELRGHVAVLGALDNQLTQIIEPSPAAGADDALRRWTQAP